jgi:hypothetical protein
MPELKLAGQVIPGEIYLVLMLTFPVPDTNLVVIQISYSPGNG